MTDRNTTAFHSVTVTGDAAGNLVTTIDPPPRIRITARKAQRLLLEVIDEVGRDHQAPLVGRYVDDGCPCCIVAHVLQRAGMTVDELADLDVQLGASDITAVRLPARVRVTGPARLLLQAAQDSSDDFDPWDDALYAALLVRPYKALEDVA
jgi:hypothetical protein